jgi:hypothetical protein
LTRTLKPPGLARLTALPRAALRRFAPLAALRAKGEAGLRLLALLQL